MATLEGYEIFAELKRGPWIAIYKAFDRQRQRTVLVKMLQHADAPATVREQLGVESDLRQQLSHPNLRAIYDAGQTEGRAFLVLEYVEGPTLAEVIAQDLPIELCAWITKEVAKALAAIHRQGLLHRDLKPQNIFISQNGEVKLGDLGLAVDCNEVSTNLAGTPAYFSPELILGQNVSSRSDLFSLGAVLYEMLTAASPFADHTTSAILHRIANLEPAPPEKLRPGVPIELAALCRRLLAKNPEQRCRDAEEVVALLEQFEKNHQLALSAKNLALFLEQPQKYECAQFKSQPPATPLLAALPPSSSQKMRSLAKKRGLMPALFATSVLFSFIFLNFENKAEEQAPAARIAEMPSVRPGFEWEAAMTSAGPVKTNSSFHAKSVLPEKPEPIAPASENRALALPTPGTDPIVTTSAVVIKEKIHASSVLVLSEPRAQVFVEKDSLGLTPVRWSPARADQVYELRLVSPALPPVYKLVTATILESDTLALNLWKEFSYLEITVHPWGEIWIDGKAVDTTPLAAALTLTPGLHELDVRHPQLGIRSQRLILTKGDTLRKVVNLLAP